MKKLFILTIILFTVQFLAPIFGQSEQKPKLVVQTGHSDYVFPVDFSPKLKVLASGSADTTIKLWDTLTGRELRTLIGHNDKVHSVKFSSDGKRLISASWDKTIKLWNVENGQLIRTFIGHTEMVFSVVFSKDGKLILSGDRNKTINLWDVESGKLLNSLKTKLFLESFALSPDGKLLAFCEDYQTIKLWSIDSWSLVKTLNSSGITEITFSPDGKTLASGSFNKQVDLWNVQSGKLIKSFGGFNDDISQVVFSSDGQFLASAANDKTVILHNVKTGQKIQSFVVNSERFNSINSIAFSSDNLTLATSELYNNSVKLWNIQTGQQTASLAGRNNSAHTVTFSKSGKLLSATYSRGIKIWDFEVGQQNKYLIGHNFSIISTAFSLDEKRLASAGNDGIKLWDIETGKLIKSFTDQAQSVSFSPDGNFLASSYSNCIFLSGINTSGETFTSERDCQYSIKLWEIESGQHKEIMPGNKEILSQVRAFSEKIKIFFSPDGKVLAIGSGKKAIKFWDILTEQEIKYEQQPLWFNFPDKWESFFNLKKAIIQAKVENSKIKLINASNKKEIAELISLDKNDWVVTTPDGRFDTNKLENPQGLHWIMPDAPFTPLSFEVFMRDYYEPNLLPRLLKCNEENNCEQEFKLVRDLTSLNRTQPKIEIKNVGKADASGVVEVTVEAENVTSEFQKGADKKFLDSGVFDLRLFRDGQLVGNSTSDEDLRKTFRSFENFDEELKIWREANKVETAGGKRTFTFRVKLPNDALKKAVEFSAYAFNDDRVKSETSYQTFTLEKSAAFKPKPRGAYLITFGVNRYENSAWDLQFAGNDARAMREIVGGKLRDGKQFEEVVEIPLISDDETVDGKIVQKRDASKANMRTALELLSGKSPDAAALKNLERAIGLSTLAKIKQANPDDIVLISFSSHGYADRNGIFYILPTDIGADSDRAIDEKMLLKFISSDELSLWLRDVDAGEMVMIVDACYADAFKGKDFKPAPMGSRGLGQLAFDKGMKILSATQAANVAIETGGRIGHGLLTYALLKEGLEKSDADFKAKDKTINVREWLEFAEFRVPGLYEELKKGNLKSIGKGVEIVDLGGKKEDESTQRPSLFDFTRKPDQMTLVNLQ